MMKAAVYYVHLCNSHSTDNTEVVKKQVDTHLKRFDLINRWIGNYFAINWRFRREGITTTSSSSLSDENQISTGAKCKWLFVVSLRNDNNSPSMSCQHKLMITEFKWHIILVTLLFYLINTAVLICFKVKLINSALPYVTL